jgi:hypothetical protein
VATVPETPEPYRLLSVRHDIALSNLVAAATVPVGGHGPDIIVLNFRADETAAAEVTQACRGIAELLSGLGRDPMDTVVAVLSKTSRLYRYTEGGALEPNDDNSKWSAVKGAPNHSAPYWWGIPKTGKGTVYWTAIPEPGLVDRYYPMGTRQAIAVHGTRARVVDLDLDSNVIRYSKPVVSDLPEGVTIVMAIGSKVSGTMFGHSYRVVFSAMVHAGPRQYAVESGEQLRRMVELIVSLRK